MVSHNNVYLVLFTSMVVFGTPRSSLMQCPVMLVAREQLTIPS